MMIRLADLQQAFSATIPEPTAENGAENTLQIVITDATWAAGALGDYVLASPANLAGCQTDVTGGFTYGRCSDLIRIVNVNNVANIFFRSDPIGDITDIPGPFTMNARFRDESAAVLAALPLSNAAVTINAQFVSDLDGGTSGVPSDGLRLTANPEPGTWGLLAAGLIGLAGLRRGAALNSRA